MKIACINHNSSLSNPKKFLTRVKYVVEDYNQLNPAGLDLDLVVGPDYSLVEFYDKDKTEINLMNSSRYLDFFYRISYENPRTMFLPGTYFKRVGSKELSLV
ncbi:MAG: hypothetical protein QXJ28_03315, partial [Candidatus Pacearchaeota archaeon]